MSNYRILVADSIAAEGVQQLRAGADVSYQPDISAEQLAAEIGNYDALVVRSRTKVKSNILKAGVPRLKVVGRAGVGVDNIDLPTAQAVGVTVVNSPLAATVAVAEHTFALLLSVARHIPFSDGSIKQGGWPKKEAMGVELYRKTLGLLAVGRIGASVAKRARAFGMDVIAYDPYVDEDNVRERGCEPVTFEELLAKSDFISVHAPLTPETKHILGAEAFGKMKKDVRIVCAARGGIIDEAALLDALTAGKVGGVGLDVFEVEPTGASPLVTHPRVVATPHSGAMTEEAQDRAGVDIAEEVLRALNGDELRWKVC
jgi:D-3-phosphoglycerate dehydrogenase